MADEAPEIELSNATNGDETQLFLKIAENFVEVAEVTELADLPSGTQSTYEMTHMKSGRFKEFKKNRRIDGTETDITGNYSLADGLAALEAAEASVGAIEYKIVLVEGDDIYDGVGWGAVPFAAQDQPDGRGSPVHDHGKVGVADDPHEARRLMVAPIDASASFEADGESFTLRMNFRTIALAEAEQPTALMNFGQGRPTVSGMALLIWAFAQPAHEDLTKDQALALAIRHGDAVGKALREVITGSSAVAEPGKGDGPTHPRRRRPGANQPA